MGKLGTAGPAGPWAVVWRHGPAVLRYLRGIGFRFRCRVGRVWVYRLPPSRTATLRSHSQDIHERLVRM